MAILFTGGTGKTSIRLARFLQNANISFLLASRRGSSAAPAGMPAAKFDWLDKETWKASFGGKPISAIYLMEPLVAEPWKPMIEFTNYTRNVHGVTRFVLVAGTSTDLSRPENLTDEAPRPLIREHSKIYTACGDGKIPFVSAIDIAAVAFRALTDPKSHNCDYRVLGPELLTYDEVAEKLSAHLGRRIGHVKLSGDERYKGLTDAGVSDYFARFLTSLEVAAAGGFESRMYSTVEEVTGA
ncbi:ergot alkaloid biosynthetic protein A [Arthroderma uncinatum]|uniref:ergot alkaloid biosynthetic protein A n=1 Tax=Arthroderma uncinatum TaxID=74035 RepID=UPI00144ACA7A|nr:ergot alkaloid biosynthetic protein A [Arthroderma uncinatum]KAF3483675.1 ergot alkaloid biosynthetic protein A [Arthroderma uncinatum]